MGIRGLLLAAGEGTRLRPLSDNWPKPLMPISGVPVLEYWLSSLYLTGIQEVWVNVHAHADAMQAFLRRDRFEGWVKPLFETELRGTAGTIGELTRVAESATLLVAHADNWCNLDLPALLSAHENARPRGCVMTMVTFDTTAPETCGIVTVDSSGVVMDMHEKVKDPPGHVANAAIYVLEGEVLDFIAQKPQITDFSRQVIPHFLGRIYAWHHSGPFRDIGTVHELCAAQDDLAPALAWDHADRWSTDFQLNPIHRQLVETC